VTATPAGGNAKSVANTYDQVAKGGREEAAVLLGSQKLTKGRTPTGEKGERRRFSYVSAQTAKVRKGKEKYSRFVLVGEGKNVAKKATRL